MRRRRRNSPRKDVGLGRRGGKARAPRTAPFLGKCEDCHEEIMFVRYIKHPHKWCPMDLSKRHDDANIRLRGDYYELCSETDAENFRRQGTQMFKNHLIVCLAKGEAANPS